jgi:hypothetical protein
MLDRGDDGNVPFPLRHPPGLAASARAPRTRSQRPAADTSLTAAGRSASISDNGPPELGDKSALSEEVERLRARVSQQDESLARLADALGALRSDRDALDAENRKLRLSLRESRLGARARFA